MDFRNIEIRMSGGSTNSDPTLSNTIGVSNFGLQSKEHVPTPAAFSGFMNIGASLDLDPATPLFLVYTAATRILRLRSTSGSDSGSVTVTLVSTPGVPDTTVTTLSLFQPAVSLSAKLTITYDSDILPSSDIAETALPHSASAVSPLFAPTTSQESLSGDTKYALIYLTNSHATDSFNLSSISKHTAGSDISGVNLQIGKPAVYAKNTEPTPAEVANPSTLAYSATISGAISAIGPGDWVPIFIKQAVSAGNTITNTDIEFVFLLTVTY
jgi:hypothetical protein